MPLPKKERNRIAILKVLADSTVPLGAARLRSALLAAGTDIQPRTVRFHLLGMDREGLTTTVSRRAGRIITPHGRAKAAGAEAVRRIGLAANRIDALGYQATIRADRPGSVILNVSLIYPEHLNRALNEIRIVLRHNLGVGSRLIVARPGEIVAGTVIPENYVALGTVCSVTIDSALLHGGVPVRSRFGGLMEVRNRQPIRFAEFIEYRGSTLSPQELFIQAGMTGVRTAAQTGSGLICATFREVPAVAIEDVRRIERRLRGLGLTGIVEVGKPNQALMGISVSDGHAGMVVCGGLNPIAALRESGIPVMIGAMAGLHDIAALKTIDEIQRQLAR